MWRWWSWMMWRAQKWENWIQRVHSSSAPKWTSTWNDRLILSQKYCELNLQLVFGDKQVNETLWNGWMMLICIENISQKKKPFSTVCTTESLGNRFWQRSDTHLFSRYNWQLPIGSYFVSTTPNIHLQQETNIYGWWLAWWCWHTQQQYSILIATKYGHK